MYNNIMDNVLCTGAIALMWFVAGLIWGWISHSLLADKKKKTIKMCSRPDMIINANTKKDCYPL